MRVYASQTWFWGSFCHTQKMGNLATGAFIDVISKDHFRKSTKKYSFKVMGDLKKKAVASISSMSSTLICHRYNIIIYHIICHSTYHSSLLICHESSTAMLLDVCCFLKRPADTHDVGIIPLANTYLGDPAALRAFIHSMLIPRTYAF